MPQYVEIAILRKNIEKTLIILKSNYDKTVSNYSKLKKIDVIKHETIEKLMKSVDQLIVQTFQIALSVLPGIGPVLATGLAGMARGIFDDKPLDVVSGAAGLALGIEQKTMVPSKIGSEIPKSVPGAYVEKGESALITAMAKLEDPRVAKQIGTPSGALPDLESDLISGSIQDTDPRLLEEILHSLNQILERVNTINGLLGTSGILFVPCLLAYDLTPELATTTRPYFMQADVSEQYRVIPTPGQNLTLKFNFALQVYPTEDSRESLYTDTQVHKIKLYKTGFLKYLDEWGLSRTLEPIPTRGRYVSLINNTFPFDESIARFLEISWQKFCESTQVFALSHEAHPFSELNNLIFEPLKRLFAGLGLEIHEGVKSYNPIHYMFSILDPEFKVTDLGYNRKKIVLSWLYVYKIFELHLGQPLPALVPPTPVNVEKMKYAFCDIIDLAGRSSFFVTKNKDASGKTIYINLLLYSLLHLPGIFEFYFNLNLNSGISESFEDLDLWLMKEKASAASVPPQKKEYERYAKVLERNYIQERTSTLIELEPIMFYALEPQYENKHKKRRAIDNLFASIRQYPEFKYLVNWFPFDEKNLGLKPANRSLKSYEYIYHPHPLEDHVDYDKEKNIYYIRFPQPSTPPASVVKDKKHYYEPQNPLFSIISLINTRIIKFTQISYPDLTASIYKITPAPEYKRPLSLSVTLPSPASELGTPLEPPSPLDRFGAASAASPPLGGSSSAPPPPILRTPQGVSESVFAPSAGMGKTELIHMAEESVKRYAISNDQSDLLTSMFYLFRAIERD